MRGACSTEARLSLSERVARQEPEKADFGQTERESTHGCGSRFVSLGAAEDNPDHSRASWIQRLLSGDINHRDVGRFEHEPLELRSCCRCDLRSSELGEE